MTVGLEYSVAVRRRKLNFKRRHFSGQESRRGVCGFRRIALLPFTQTVGKGGVFMKDGKKKNGAAFLAWEMFEKTGSIAYYMLFHELNNGGRH